MEIDHVFILIDPLGPEIDYLRSLGITETYRRRHVGQGTQNICYCFENMFLELLWIDDADSVRSERIARTGIYERAQWKTAGTNPFGIAWRDTPSEAPFAPPTWAFKPPYLPAGMHIDVAVDGDDHYQPMMFKSPGAKPPSEWPADKRGALQTPAGLGHVISVQFNAPLNFVPSGTLNAIKAASILKLGVSHDSSFKLTLTVERLNSPQPLVLQLPVKNGRPLTTEH
jgi:Glyoxalase-like domain